MGPDLVSRSGSQAGAINQGQRGAIRPTPALAALLVLMLSACSPDDSDPGPGGVSVGEARALDEAAAMIEENAKVPATSAPEAPEPSVPAKK